MKILLVGKPWRGGLVQYLEQTLRRQNGIEVVWLPTYPVSMPDRIAYALDRKGWRSRLIKRIAQSDCDAELFVNAHTEYAQLPRRENRVLWLTDDPRHLLPYLEPFGRIFCSDPGYLAELNAGLASGRSASVLPFAHCPEIHTPFGSGTEGKGVCFVANRDEKRDPYIAKAMAADLPLTVYGNYFLHHPLHWQYPRHFRPSISYSRQGDVYRRFALSLNVHASVVRGGTNMRTFECAGFGIAQAVEARPGLEDYFTPGEELLTFTTPEEMIAVVERLLRDQALRQRLAENARKRCLTEHTYAKRLSTMFRDMVSKEFV
jgi:spore maturation protein CgeB